MAKAYVEAGVGEVGTEFSVGAEAKGPNASAGIGIDADGGAEAMARAELGSASVHAGPLGVKVGLGVDTGASVGPNGLEVKVLGTGLTLGPNPSIAILGSEVSCSVM